MVDNAASVALRSELNRVRDIRSREIEKADQHVDACKRALDAAISRREWLDKAIPFDILESDASQRREMREREAYDDQRQAREADALRRSEQRLIARGVERVTAALLVIFVLVAFTAMFFTGHREQMFLDGGIALCLFISFAFRWV